MSRPRTASTPFTRRLAAMGRRALVLWCAAAACLVPVRVRIAEAAESACGCSAATREAGACCCVPRETSGSGCCAAKTPTPPPARSCCAAKSPASEFESEIEQPRESAKPQAETMPHRAEIRSCPCGGGSSVTLGCDQPRLAARAPGLLAPRRTFAAARSRTLDEPQWVESPGTPPPEVGRA
ncbi:MAG: hypothetical protein WD066_20075 [Planctomycetaceae bacterium]